MADASQRPWLNFSLRALIVAAIPFACWLGWNLFLGYDPTTFKGDGRITDSGFWSHPRYRIVMPEVSLAKAGENTFTLENFPSTLMTISFRVTSGNLSDDESQSSAILKCKLPDDAGVDRTRFVRAGIRRLKEADGFFLRAESFYNAATDIDRISDPLYLARHFGGIAPHERSHGESFFSLMLDRFKGKDSAFMAQGLYMANKGEIGKCFPLTSAYAWKQVEELGRDAPFRPMFKYKIVDCVRSEYEVLIRAEYVGPYPDQV